MLTLCEVFQLLETKTRMQTLPLAKHLSLQGGVEGFCPAQISHITTVLKGKARGPCLTILTTLNLVSTNRPFPHCAF
jgi:hypothetical protein